MSVSNSSGNKKKGMATKGGRNKKKQTNNSTNRNKNIKGRGIGEGNVLDKFLNMMDDPEYWRKLSDPSTGEEVKLSAEEVDIISRALKGTFGDADFDPYAPYVDFFTKDVMVTPITGVPEPKRRFTPSKWEHIRIMKYVKAIKEGRMAKPKSEEEKKVEREEALRRPPVYDLWNGEVLDTSVLSFHSRHIPAPRLILPHHRESYNPPAEYLLDEKEKEEWEGTAAEDRSYDFLPQKYSSLRLVPGYGGLVKERNERCLDLFLCPRAIKNKVVMNPDDLLPKLPDPRDLRPFPTHKSIDFVGHEAGQSIKSISVDPSGQWLLSASSDNSIKMWDVQTGHCRFTWQLSSSAVSADGAKITCVAWNPNKEMFVFAAAINESVYLIVPPEMSLTEPTLQAIDKLQEEFAASSKDETSQIKSALEWRREGSSATKGLAGCIYEICHSAPVVEVTWHRRGDYFASLCPDAPSAAKVISIHQISRKTSQLPFQKMPGILRSIRFHPTQPHLVLATQKTVRIYDLVKRTLLKKLAPHVQSVSSLAMHVGGDNLIVGSHDSKLVWFDLDYSVRPYRTLNNHKNAIRSVSFHPSHPLMASCGDDGVIQVLHAQVYADLTMNALIVPVKTISDFASSTVTQVVFHPVQPWLFASTSTGSLSLFV